jgi:hypothetical protein
MADAPQVAYGTARPQVAYDTAPPEVYIHQTPHTHAQVPQKPGAHAYYYDPKVHEGYTGYAGYAAAPAHATVLGLRRGNFWLLVVLAVVVVGAAVGGSVGGTMAVRRKAE